MTAPAPPTSGGTMTETAAANKSRTHAPPSGEDLQDGTHVAADEQPSKTLWERSVRKRLGKLFAERSPDAAHAAWSDYLEQRSNVKLAAELGGKRSPLLWGLPSSLLDDEALDLVNRLHDCARGKSSKSGDLTAAASDWLQRPPTASAAGAIVALAWAYSLPSLAMHLDGRLWWRLFHRLHETATESVAAGFVADALGGQLYGGELPRLFAHQFPELADARSLAEASRRTLSESLPELLDGQGAPHARHIPIYRALAACWTRCATIAEAGGGKSWSCKSWNRDAATQYEWVVRHLLRTARHDGSQALTTEPTCDGPHSEALLQAALRIGGNKIDRALATVALPGLKAKTTAEEWEPPSMESEWGQHALLRRDWSRKTPQLHVSFDAGATMLELAHGRRMLLQGLHDFAVTLDGQPVARRADSHWELVCWESDDDVDYLELEMELAGGTRVQRSYLLIREDDALLMSDVVLTTGASKLRHRVCLPLAEAVVFHAEQETRDGWLVSDKPLARVLPLGLPEWRVDPRGGQMFMEAGVLVVEQEVDGSALMAPLFLDLSRRRGKYEGTWRQLTVAEDRRIQPRDVAVGYRAQVGDDQWLLYRSLAPVALRTLLGQHLGVEFYCGRFDDDGESEQLISVE